MDPRKCNEPSKTTLDSIEITMSFSVCFLEQRKPSLVLTAALRKVECARAILARFPIFLFGILHTDLLPRSFFHIAFIEVSSNQIELVINDGLDPFPI